MKKFSAKFKLPFDSDVSYYYTCIIIHNDEC